MAQQFTWTVFRPISIYRQKFWLKSVHLIFLMTKKRYHSNKYLLQPSKKFQKLTQKASEFMQVKQYTLQLCYKQNFKLSFCSLQAKKSRNRLLWINIEKTPSLICCFEVQFKVEILGSLSKLTATDDRHLFKVYLGFR